MGPNISTSAMASKTTMMGHGMVPVPMAATMVDSACYNIHYAISLSDL
jgi:hypothetical protein